MFVSFYTAASLLKDLSTSRCLPSSSLPLCLYEDSMCYHVHTLCAQKHDVWAVDRVCVFVSCSVNRARLSEDSPAARSPLWAVETPDAKQINDGSCLARRTLLLENQIFHHNILRATNHHPSPAYPPPPPSFLPPPSSSPTERQKGKVDCRQRLAEKTLLLVRRDRTSLVNESSDVATVTKNVPSQPVHRGNDESFR